MAVLGLLVVAAGVFPLILVAVACAALLLVRVLSRRDGFGFADGFLRFDDRIRLPRGVQEDDDFRWHWTA